MPRAILAATTNRGPWIGENERAGMRAIFFDQNKRGTWRTPPTNWISSFKAWRGSAACQGRDRSPRRERINWASAKFENVEKPKHTQLSACLANSARPSDPKTAPATADRTAEEQNKLPGGLATRKSAAHYHGWRGASEGARGPLALQPPAPHCTCQAACPQV